MDATPPPSAAHQARAAVAYRRRGCWARSIPSGPSPACSTARLPLPSGDPAYRAGRAFEPRFSETSSGSLAFSVQVPENGPAGRAVSRRRARRSGTCWAATSADRPCAGSTANRRAQSIVGNGDSATVVSAFDRDGFREAQVTYLWGPWFTDGLPDAALRVGRDRDDHGAGCRSRPSPRSGPRAPERQPVDDLPAGAELPLAALEPMMDRLGLGQQHQSLMTAVAFALGARYTLPAGSAMLTLPPIGTGIELRLDVDLELDPRPAARTSPTCWPCSSASDPGRCTRWSTGWPPSAPRARRAPAACRSCRSPSGPTCQRDSRSTSGRVWSATLPPPPSSRFSGRCGPGQRRPTGTPERQSGDDRTPSCPRLPETDATGPAGP